MAKEPKRKPQRETVIIKTTRERVRNADGGALSSANNSNRLLNAAGAAMGGAASVVVAEKLGMSPTWAGVTTAGGALLASSIPKDERWREALYAASLGAGGIVGVQLLAEWMARRKSGEARPAAAPSATHRQADGDSPSYVTRAELNEALGQLADKSAQQQKQATCDLLTALREEVRRIVIDVNATPGAQPPRMVAKPTTTGTNAEPYMRPYSPMPPRPPSPSADEPRNGDDYMSSAYGGRNAFYGDERNGFDERDASFEERDAAFEERDAAFEERDSGFEERDASFEDERNAEE
jgi:hypothetical protein